jgi:hypothetical protein
LTPVTSRLALVTVLVCLASACSGSADPSPSAPEPSRSALAVPTETVTLTPSLDPELAAASDLAAAAESMAGTLPSTPAIEPRDQPVIGADISWPQCPPGMGIVHKETSGQPLPTEEAEYVVIGLTNGPGFHANPCLADQVAWAKGRGLLTAAYAVASYPSDAELVAYGGEGPYDGSTTEGALKNVGYQQARFNVVSMREAGLGSPLVWIDVEPVPFYDWSGDKATNAAVVIGLAQGYLNAGLQIGVYSTPALWDGVVGELAFGVPEWRAAGQTSQAEALDRCGKDWSIQGGDAVLGQWVQDRRDKNITCPGIEADLGRWFAAP